MFLTFIDLRFISDAVGGSDYPASNGRKISEKWIIQDTETTERGLVQDTIPGFNWSVCLPPPPRPKEIKNLKPSLSVHKPISEFWTLLVRN
jgi:hypothetical protein